MLPDKFFSRISFIALTIVASSIPVFSQEYVLLGWNDLGMHCSNKDFSKIAVLPPYNTLTAQLVVKNPGQLPQIVTSGYTVDYSIPNNSYSVGKTNFWSYAQQLFGLAAPLPDNIGLTGKGLTGTMDSSGSHYYAMGIPVTPFTDSDLVNESPYQMIHLVARRVADGTAMASTDIVIPVSNEVGCVQSGCHSSETQILNEHESVKNFNRNGPVLCAACHSSNALGTPGIAEARPFSFRMHDTHKNVAGPANDVATCYKCHPGPKTQCLRDIMGKNPTQPLKCQNCHGTMADVASSITGGRRPWLDEPKCGTCHGNTYAEEPGKLYRQSTGHGGLFCSACHGSPHAILPTIQANDNVQNIRLQGYAGTLRTCSVCHVVPPAGPGPHGIMDTVLAALAAPRLSSPDSGATNVPINAQLRWQSEATAQAYALEVSSDSLFSVIYLSDSGLTLPTKYLFLSTGGQTFYWHVRVNNQGRSGPWSNTWSFTSASGAVYSHSVTSSWNLISLPVNVGDARVSTLYPSAVSRGFRYAPRGIYVQEDTFAVGDGYWLKFGKEQLVGVSGTPVTSETLDVAAGWNLVGSLMGPTVTNTIATIPSGLISSGFFGYRGSYVLTDTLRAFEGYWVKMHEAGKLILSSPAPAAAAKNTFTTNATEWTTILVTDAEGRSQVLYLSGKREDPGVLSRFEMPPLPPEGSFDVRFASNRLLESYSGTEAARYPITVVSGTYPLIVSWQNRLAGNDLALNTGDGTISMSADGSVSIRQEAPNLFLEVLRKNELPHEASLLDNYPNPFNPSTIIRYQLPDRVRVSLKVYSVFGQEVATLVDELQNAGLFSVRWNAENAASGIYFYKLSAGTVSSVRKMILVK